MITRKELITSPEYWQEMISLALWSADGSGKFKPKKHDVLAAQIIKYPLFMKTIKELSELPSPPANQ